MKEFITKQKISKLNGHFNGYCLVCVESGGEIEHP